MDDLRREKSPRRVAVVGAGIAGLSTAWFLQEHGIEVTVLDRIGVAAGASWGNAGWLMAGDATPLPSPEVFREGLRGLLGRSPVLRVPLFGDPGLYRFLMHFARHCTSAQWERSLRALIPVSSRALDAYDSFADGGVAVTSTLSTNHLTLFTSTAGQDAYVRHLEHLRELGSQTEFAVMDAHEARDASPLTSPAVVGAVGLRGQRYIDPTAFVPSLAESVLARGGAIESSVDVRAVRDLGGAVEVLVNTQAVTRVLRCDAVVVCTGAWLGELVGRFGVRVPVRAGRGYSFSAALDVDVTDPIYLPSAHLACTPMRGRLRIAGTMEFRSPTAPMDPTCVDAMVAAARQVLQGVDLDDRRDLWVGPRPVTADGRPLVGPTRSPRIWCVGGHAMEGMVLGPATAKLASEALVSGVVPELLRPFDPVR